MNLREGIKAEIQPLVDDLLNAYCDFLTKGSDIGKQYPEVPAKVMEASGALKKYIETLEKEALKSKVKIS